MQAVCAAPGQQEALGLGRDEACKLEAVLSCEGQG